ncbi:MAG TPA: AbrB/MazE/SpoVT family DNA-binding domain-containing protein [Candidatus Nanoarchaeia archaeon]|nr:AbrB/MazE/SpoVT family DNA-binding domain-containing protein [Candidatus Nanoarchaeia archaeon]
MATEVTVRKWGNSMGVILPKQLMEQEGLKENEKIFLEIVKEADLRDIFGTLKTKVSGQKFKDMARKGWEN